MLQSSFRPVVTTTEPGAAITEARAPRAHALQQEEAAAVRKPVHNREQAPLQLESA